MQPLQPYAPPQQGAYRPPASGGRGCFMLAGGAVLLCVLGFVGLCLIGINLLESEVTAIMRAHPAAVAALGQVSACSYDWGGSSNDERPEYHHYRCTGDKQSGLAILHTTSTGPEGEEELVDGTLVLQSGDKIELKP